MWGRGVGCLLEPLLQGRPHLEPGKFLTGRNGTCAPFLPPFPTPPTSEVDPGLQGGDREEAKVGGGSMRVPTVLGAGSGSQNTPCVVGRRKVF